jgi:hypothetical protein
VTPNCDAPVPVELIFLLQPAKLEVACGEGFATKQRSCMATKTAQKSIHRSTDAQSWIDAFSRRLNSGNTVSR